MQTTDSLLTDAKLYEGAYLAHATTMTTSRLLFQFGDTGRQQFLIEKRHADGSLDFTLPQPKKQITTIDELHRAWFAAHQDADIGVSGTAVVEWFEETTGFVIRRKTWR